METSIKRGKLKNLGMTIMEALVAAVIVGIGFIAVMQMIQYSMRSSDISTERTKVNYLTDMLTEDLIAYKDSEKSNEKMVDIMRSKNQWFSSGCRDTVINLPDKNNAFDNRLDFWRSRLSKEFLKCTNDQKKKLNVFKICNPSATNCESSDISRTTEFEGIYVGRIEMQMPGRSVPHVLYFQAK